MSHGKVPEICAKYTVQVLAHLEYAKEGLIHALNKSPH